MGLTGTMANRHKSFKRGGRTVYSGAGSNVVKEAESTENKKEGGHVHGKGGKKRLDKRARGGQTPYKDPELMGGDIDPDAVSRKKDEDYDAGEERDSFIAHALDANDRFEDRPPPRGGKRDRQRKGGRVK
jgi:hypothetical protein